MKFIKIFTLIFLFSCSSFAMPRGYFPMMWLDEKNLVAVFGNEILQYNIELNQSVKTFYKADRNLLKLDPTHFCFAQNRWILRAVKLDDTVNTLDLNPHDLRQARLHDGFGNFNQFACTPENEMHQNLLLAAPPPEISFHNKNFSFMRFAPRGQLIKESDGEAYIYASSNSFLINARNSEGVDKKIILSGSNHQNISDFNGVNSTFDKVKNLYLWYLETTCFQKNAWPLKAWWISRDLDVVSDLFIPQGPWVGEQKTNCSDCKAEMKIYSNDGKIFIKIWGDAINLENRGIYQLMNHADSEKAHWKKIIFEEVSSEILFSPDSCRIAYLGKNNEAKISSICHLQEANHNF